MGAAGAKFLKKLRKFSKKSMGRACALMGAPGRSGALLGAPGEGTGWSWTLMATVMDAHGRSRARHERAMGRAWAQKIAVAIIKNSKCR